MNPTVLGGPASVAINGWEIPSHLISEVNVEVTEGTRERSTLGGTFTRPSGVVETAMARFSLYLPNMDYLKHIFPGRYNAPTAPETAGNVIVNSNNCAVTDAGPVNIHYTCETNDRNDIFLYNAQAQLNFNATLNADDDLTIEVTLHAQPDENGNIARFGTGDLTAESVWDVETEATTAVA
jgi:hypothetical protein